jgi:hypothetical protein
MNAADTGRTCGSCSMCCFIFPVPEVEDKQKNTWCRHCRPGEGGCSIYDTRPPVCRKYTCSWLAGDLPMHWQPLRSNLVLDKQVGNSLLRVFALPDHPNQWRAEPFHGELKALARTGLTGIDEAFYLTIVYADNSTFYVILPHSDVRFDRDMFIDVREVGREIFYGQELTLTREKKFERRLSEAVMITRHLTHRRNPDDCDPDQDDDDALDRVMYEAMLDDLESDPEFQARAHAARRAAMAKRKTKASNL